MFEEVCLVCGKHLHDDRQAYCGEDCQNIDLTSPSISSSSSAVSSPNLGYAAGADVPSLTLSALGSAFKDYTRTRGQCSFSSASSTCCSALSDDDDYDNIMAVNGSDCSLNDCGDSLYVGKSKPYIMNRSALSYARQPSGTNNGSSYSHSRKRPPTGAPYRHVRGYPQSAPIHSHSSTEDEESSDCGSSSRDAFDIDENDIPPENHSNDGKSMSSPSMKTKRRNRASLPAYFSLLMTSSSNEAYSSPLSSSSGHTVARLSPPTPKLPTTTGILHKPVLSTAPAMPRGRRRVQDEVRSGRSSSRSQSRPAITGASLRTRNDGKGSVEQVFDWSSMPSLPPRGRAAVRRNSSPPPKVLMGLDNLSQALTNARKAEVMDRSQSGSRTRARGRARVEELDGNGFTKDAPGFGNGRSGLLKRERERALLGMQRVPI